MVLTIATEPSPLRIGDDGAIRVGNSRVVLDLIVECYRNGMTAEEIVADYGILDLGDVYSALGYYLHHRDEIDEYIAERRRQADEIEAKLEALQEERGLDPVSFRERLRGNTTNKG